MKAHPPLFERPVLEGPVPEVLLEKIRTGKARVAVIGLGYVGLPLAVEFSKHFHTTGFDIDERRVSRSMPARRTWGTLPTRKSAR